jgi:hypothetical protein
VDQQGLMAGKFTFHAVSAPERWGCWNIKNSIPQKTENCQVARVWQQLRCSPEWRKQSRNGYLVAPSLSPLSDKMSKNTIGLIEPESGTCDDLAAVRG